MNIVPGTSIEQLRYSVDAALEFVLGDDYTRADEICMNAAPKEEVNLQDATDESGVRSPVATKSATPPPQSLTLGDADTTAGLRMQRELNRARESFVALPLDFASKHRRIAKVFDAFAEHVAQALHDRMSASIHSGWLWKQAGLAALAGCPITRPSSPVDLPIADDERQTENTLLVRDDDEDTGEGLNFLTDGIQYTLVHTSSIVAGHRDQVVNEMMDDVRRCRAAQGLDPNAKLSAAQQSTALCMAFERVRKAAHREVKARREIIALHHMETYCQVPLCAAIDYMGFTFFAEVQCGFSSKTCQGGLYLKTADQYQRSFVSGDAMHHTRIADHLHRALGVVCGLKSHPKCGVTSYGPVDLQVHVPSDGTIYLQCCRRMYPPVLMLHGAHRPPSTIGANHSLCQQAGCRLLPGLLEMIAEQTTQSLTLSPDAWLDESSRSVDTTDVECLQANQWLHDKAVPLVAEVLARVDLIEADAHRTATPRTAAAAAPQPPRAHDTAAMASLWAPALLQQRVDNGSGTALKRLLHVYGVNICFLGRVLEHLEGLLWAVAARRHGGGVSTTQDRLQEAIAMRSLPKPSPSDVCHTDFVARHPMVLLVRIEMSARAVRAVLHSELRRTVMELSRAAAARQVGRQGIMGRRGFPKHAPLADITPSAQGVLDAFERKKKAIGEVMCDVLCRCSGELLSSQSEDDRGLWEAQVLPTMQAMFGYNIGFVRSEGSTSTLSGDAAGSTEGLSTAARIRMRSQRPDPLEHVHKELRVKPMRLGGVDVAPWGHVTDPKFAHVAPTDAYVMSQSQKAHRGDGDGPHGRFAELNTSCCDDTVDDEAFAIGVASRRGIAADAVRLGASQDYRIVQRVCAMTSCFVERRKDSPSGVGCCFEPHIVGLTDHAPLLSTWLKKIASGGSKELEVRLQEEVKERKQRLGSSTPEATFLRAYHVLALVGLLSNQPQHAVDWYRKMRDVLVRDIGSNELGQCMMMLAESRVELLRKRYHEAADIANHVTSTIQLMARETQLLPVAMMAQLDSLYAADAQLASSRNKKTELARLLIPQCMRYGLGVGRVTAREAVGRIQAALSPKVELASMPVAVVSTKPSTPPRARRKSSNTLQQQVQPQPQAVKPSRQLPRGQALVPLDPELTKVLAACCVVVLREQGLDAEAASFVMHLLVYVRDPQLLPLATALATHTVPLVSALFRPNVELLCEGLLDRVSQSGDSGSIADGTTVALRELQQMLTTPHDAIKDPAILLAYFRQQLATRRLQENAAAASASSVLVRGVSTVHNAAKRMASFQRQTATVLSPRKDATEAPDDEDRLECQGFYYLRKDKSIKLRPKDVDALAVHCTIHLIRGWAQLLVEHVPEGDRCEPQRWDVASASAYGDIVNVTKHFGDARIDLAIYLNRMMSTIFDERTLPKPLVGATAGKNLELLAKDHGNAVTPIEQLIVGDEGYRMASAQAPVSLLSGPFLVMLHDACAKTIQRQTEILRLTDPPLLGPHILDSEPKKGPQLEWVKELFLAAEIGIELVASLRVLFRYGSRRATSDLYHQVHDRHVPQERAISPTQHGRSGVHSAATVFPFAASVAEEDDGVGGPGNSTGLMRTTLLSVEAMAHVVSIFNPAVVTSACVTHPLHVLTAQYVLGEQAPAQLARIAVRFPMQRYDLWSCFFRVGVVLYEAEVELSAPIEEPTSAGRTDAQLIRLRSILVRLVELSGEHLGSFPNRWELVDALEVYTKRLQRTPHSHREGGVPCQPATKSNIAPHDLGEGAAGHSHVSPRTTHGAQHHPPHHRSPASQLHTLDSSLSTIARQSSTAALSSSMKRTQSLLQEPLMAFSVTPSELCQGEVLRIQWTLPTRVPPRFAAVGVFVEPLRGPLVAPNALELHKGLRFRHWQGDEDIHAPMKSGWIRVVFFITSHSDGLPVQGMEASVRVHPRKEHSGPLPQLRHEVLGLPVVTCATVVVPSPTCSFIPCDSVKSQRARSEAQVRRVIAEQRHGQAAPSHAQRPALTPSPIPSTALDGELDGDTTVCCLRSASASQTSVTVVKVDPDAVEASRRRGEARYRRALRSTKSILESQGTLVVIVGNAK